MKRKKKKLKKKKKKKNLKKKKKKLQQKLKKKKKRAPNLPHATRPDQVLDANRHPVQAAQRLPSLSIRMGSEKHNKSRSPV